MNTRFFLIILFVSFFSILSAKNYDVVVYGSSSAGVTAAVQASRMDKDVLLISTDDHIGGLSSSGLGATDINRHKAIGGMAREFYQRVYNYYKEPSVWEYQEREAYFKSILKRIYTGRSEELKMQWAFEPHIAEMIFRDMLMEAGVKVMFGERLDLSSQVVKEGPRIKSIKMESGLEIRAKIFVDATYEGDLMARAGVKYIVGRESNKTYDEKYNGVIISEKWNHIYGRGEKSIDPYIVPGVPSSGLLPYIDPEIPGEPGSADNGVQAYCFRLTLTDDPANQIPITKPANYNPLLYEALGRKLEMFPEMKLHDRNTDAPNLLTFSKMPNRKTDTNHLDFVGASHEWPEGDYETRDSLYQLHKDHHLGLLWFLKTDPRVPEGMRTEMAKWGLAKDEYEKYNHFPPRIYIREARRMISDYVMTEHNIIGSETVENAVGLGTYAMDSHQVSSFVNEKGEVFEEGKFFITRGVRPYPISYQSIIPSREDCSNLLVPVCLSASHAVYGSIRMEPVYMVLGQSAGIAAVLSINNDQNLADVPYPELYKLLMQNDQIVFPDQITK